MKEKRKGLTLPAESGQEKVVRKLAEKWGADALRDSDGTVLSDEIINMEYDIYSTVCIVRAEQDYARKVKEKMIEGLPGKFLMSNPVTAVSDKVEINLMELYFNEKYIINKKSDPEKYWEVIDRTTNNVVDVSGWEFNPDTEKVIIKNAKKFHAYTVNFLVYQIWDSTSMYNHITNNWNREHVISVDPYHPNIYNHLMEYFEQWLKNHPYTKVVRLTTLAYHFPIDSLPGGGTKFRDWLGYTDAISPGALDDFEKEKGYKLRSEDIVDGGYYNATYRVPSEKYLEWMDFIHKFVVRFGKDLTDRIHKAGKKAALFWGDHWIGTEPYSSHFQKMNIDINIGACRDGVGLRRIADAPGNQEKEIRLYPYFFPDVFKPGGDPTGESMDNWIKIRRALLRKKVDRIGYGGYLSLAVKFNDFLEHVEELCNQFREIKNNSEPEESYKAPVRVAVLNAWGKSRSWINDLGVDYKLNSNKNPSNFLECLSGLPFNVEFINFDDIEKKGVLDNIDIIINNGEAGSAWSGGFHWKNEKIRSIIKEWVYCGGGFIGIGDPSAYDTDISYFQLSDVLGVDKEIGKSIACSAYEFKLKSDHFILEDSNDKIKLTAEKSYVYKSSRKTDVLLSGEGIHILMAANKFGKGRSVYMASLPYSLQNSRILLRSIFWASNKENEMKKWFSANINTDCAYYRSKKLLAVINNVNDEQNTTIIDDKNNEIKVFLKPYETKWLDL